MELSVYAGMHVRRHDIKCRLRSRESLVELFLQFGYGMMDHCRSLMKLGEGAVQF